MRLTRVDTEDDCPATCDSYGWWSVSAKEGGGLRLTVEGNEGLDSRLRPVGVVEIRLNSETFFQTKSVDSLRAVCDCYVIAM